MLLLDRLSPENRKVAEDWEEIVVGRTHNNEWFVHAYVPNEKRELEYWTFVGSGRNWRRRKGKKGTEASSQVPAELRHELNEVVTLVSLRDLGGVIGYNF